MLSHAKSWHQVQGGTPNEIGYLGSNFFFRQALGNLPTYVIRHIDIYGNMTSSPLALSGNSSHRHNFWVLQHLFNLLRAITVRFRLHRLLGSTYVRRGRTRPRKAGASRPATMAVKSWKYGYILSFLHNWGLFWTYYVCICTQICKNAYFNMIFGGLHFFFSWTWGQPTYQPPVRESRSGAPLLEWK